jgi:hypothetical protein
LYVFGFFPSSFFFGLRINDIASGGRVEIG